MVRYNFPFFPLSLAYILRNRTAQNKTVNNLTEDVMETCRPRVRRHRWAPFQSSLPTRMLRADIVFAGVCVSVSTKCRKLPIRNWCNLVGICPMVSARSAWKLVTFDLDLWTWEIFSYFSNSGYTFRMALPSNFISRSRFSFNVMGPRSRSRQCKSGSVQLKNYWSEIAGAWSEYLLR